MTNTVCARTRWAAYDVRSNIAHRVAPQTVAHKIRVRPVAIAPLGQAKHIHQRCPPHHVQVIIAVAVPTVTAFNCSGILGTSK